MCAMTRRTILVRSNEAILYWSSMELAEASREEEIDQGFMSEQNWSNSPMSPILLSRFENKRW